MKFEFNHFNFNVLDLEKSLSFYKDALGLIEVRRKEAADKSFILVFLGDKQSTFTLELTWLKNRKDAYNLGDLEYHLAFTVDDFGAALSKHKQLNCVCYENSDMGIYFIKDPDGYWIEILPKK